MAETLQQTQTLSLRMSEALRKRLEDIRKLTAVKRGESVSALDGTIQSDITSEMNTIMANGTGNTSPPFFKGGHYNLDITNGDITTDLGAISAASLLETSLGVSSGHWTVCVSPLRISPDIRCIRRRPATRSISISTDSATATSSATGATTLPTALSHTRAWTRHGDMSSMRQRFLGALVLSSISLQAAVAGSLVKLWELDLSRWNKPPAGNAPRFSVAALSFSPDGKRIALTSTKMKKNDGELASILLVVPVGGGAGDVKSFEAAQGGDLAEWSPSSDAIVVNGVLIQPLNGMRCEMPDTSRFISGDRLIAIKRAGHSLSSSQLTSYDKSCNRVKTWETSERWNMVDVSIQRHLLLMEKPHEENLLVDPDDGRIVRKWSVGTWPVWDGPGGKFADNGGALCNELSVEDAPKGQTLRCWKTDTGELIANAPADYATGPFATSKNSTRVIFSEVGYVKGLIRDWDTHPYKGAVVWGLCHR